MFLFFHLFLSFRNYCFEKFFTLLNLGFLFLNSLFNFQGSSLPSLEVSLAIIPHALGFVKLFSKLFSFPFVIFSCLRSPFFLRERVSLYYHLPALLSIFFYLFLPFFLPFLYTIPGVLVASLSPIHYILMPQSFPLLCSLCCISPYKLL